MRRTVGLSALLALYGCPSDPGEVLCPPGQIQSGDSCITPDMGGGEVDAGPGVDMGPGFDAGGMDAGGMDAAPIDAGAGAASIDTNMLNFGGSVLGDGARELSFEISNNTGMPVVISFGQLMGDQDFTLTSTPAPSQTLADGESITTTVRFNPETQGDRSASLTVQLCEGDCPIEVQITGEGLQEAFDCTPANIDFGFVNPGACTERTLRCENVSAYVATIATWGLTGDTASVFTLSSSTAQSTDVLGGDAHEIGLMYCPTDLSNDTGTLALTIIHPDPAFSTKAVGLSGRGGGPDIQCTPTVDFGIAGVGQTAQRTARCTNVGNAALLLSSAALDPNTPELTATLSPSTFPATLQPQEALDIDLSFAPTAAGTISTFFRVQSNDSDTPEATIAITAEAVEAGGCTVQFSPASLDFGAVQPGGDALASAVISNAGTGVCAVNVLGLLPGSDPEFSLPGGPTSLNLQPGEQASVRARFAPAAQGPRSGAIELMTTDLLVPTATIALTGEGLSLLGGVRAQPTGLDFGQVQSGCSNAVQQSFVLQNSGATDAQVTVTLDPSTSPAFTLGATPTVVPAGGTQAINIDFLPPAIGQYTGRVQIDVMGGATLFVNLSGEGTMAPVTTRSFPGQPAPQIDVLLVVDDSCSMTEEQNRLSQVAPILIARGDAAGAQYHIGVTTTDPSPGIVGTLRGTPSFVAWDSPSRDIDLQANITVGVTGSGIEQGLEGAREAATNTTLLTGTNAGFFRQNATMIVLMISDEPDQSPLTVSQYLDALQNRPIGALDVPTIYTITGGLAGCTAPGTNAAAAPRYVQAATQSGGFDRSICEQDYTALMTEIADRTFTPPRARFNLGAIPAPGTVAVRVDGQVVPPADYGVDFGTGAIIFVPGAEPVITQTVEIDYQSLCVAPTCGNMSVDPGEQCDDMNADNTDACLDICFNAFCGDGFTQVGVEDCDDGNTVPGDGCNGQCTIEGCGNGIIEPPEECDDGVANNSDTAPDACRTTCVNPTCGDLVTDTGEDCDDGNQIDTDDCIACQAAVCGDGFVQAGVEECDDGNQIDNDDCDNNCNSNLPVLTVTSTPALFAPTPGGTVMNLGDETTLTVQVGFDFNYLGTDYGTIRVSSNGALIFATGNQTASFTNQPIPSPQGADNILAWWWDDFNFARAANPPAQATTQLVGAAPNRVRIFTFLNGPPFQGPIGQVSAEVRLYEGTNVIEVYYGPLLGGAAWSASVGWEDVTGTRGLDPLGCSPGCGPADWPEDMVFIYTPN